MKWYWWILLGLVVLSLVIYQIVTIIVDKLDIEFAFSKFDIKNVKIQDVLVSGQVDANINVAVTLTNKSNISIPVNNIYVEVYYRGNLFAKSKEKITDKIVIYKNSVTVFDMPVSVMIDSNSLSLITQYIKKVPFEIEYKVKLSAFGIPVTIKDKYTEKYT